MGNYDYGTSDSDCDGFLRDEIEALSRTCKPPSETGVNGGGYLPENDDDDFDDLELVRSIQERYGVDVADDIKPLATLPPPISDDDEDDYEFYCAIKNRFSQPAAVNGCDATENNDESCRDKYVSNDVIGAGFGRESVDEHQDDVERQLFDTAEKVDAFSSASSFPWAAQTFIEAIKKNRSCQKFLRNKLLHIEAKMEEIKELRKRVKTLRDFQVQCKKKIGRALSQKQDARVQLISVHKQRSHAKATESNVSSICYGPHENSYVACYKAALEKFPLSFHRDKWSEEDRLNLEKGIVRQYQEKLLQRSAHVLSSAEEPGFTNGVDATMLLIKNQNITPKIIQCFSGEVNWEQLASTYLPCRSGEECEARWVNHENRLINLGYWTREEEIELLSLIEKNGFNSWKSIAEKLATNRTPYQCLAHYQRSLNANILRRDWTEDEDDQLRSAVESFGESNWQAVASMLEGRTGPQCSNRWKKTLHPARERVGRWGDDEDKRLKVAVTLFHKSWHRIAQFVPGRTQAQCRERWVNVLDPSLKRGEWTAEEDMKLKEAIAEHGHYWSRVAACVPLRTDNQCRRRWTRLCPHEVPLLKATKDIQKVALISNFVDREEQRPTLRPEDLVSLPYGCSTNEQENGNGTQKWKRKRKCKETEPTENLSSSCSLKRRKCKKSAKSLDNKMIGDSVADEGNCEDTDCVDKGVTSKTDLKTKKRNASKHNRQSRNKSRDLPIRIMSRRARGVRTRNNPQDVSSDLSNKEAEFSDKYNMARKSSSSKWQPVSLTLPEDNCAANEPGISDDGSQTHQINLACSNKTNARKKHKKSEVDTDQIQDWEDLPLSACSNKTNAKKKHKKSKVDTDQIQDWEDLPLSVVFKNALTQTQ